MGLEEFFHENKLALSAVGIVLGIPLTVISVLALLYSDGDTGAIQWAYDLVGTWAYWLLLPGLFFLIVGTYYFYDFARNLKEFKELMEIESKAKFIKNVDRIEELAWRLHPKYEKIVIDRKKKFKVR